MTQTALAEQMAKLNPSSGANALLARVRADQAAAAPPGGAEMPLEHPATLDAYDAASAQRDAAQAELEASHGPLSTMATQFGRGLLDAVLAPGAAVGALTEGTGSLTGWRGLEQFGRDLGESSSGKEAMATLQEAIWGNPDAGLTTAERVRRDIDEQQRAWPTLAAVSHAAGMLTPAAVGGLASSGAGALETVGLGAAEGASAGAQSGYERNEALRDVLTSALVGGALGAGTAAAGEGLAGLLTSRPLRAAARELADDQNLAAAGIERSQIGRLFGEDAAAAEQTASELAGEISSYKFTSGPLEGKPLMRLLRTPEQIQEGIGQATRETAEQFTAATEAIKTEAEKAGILGGAPQAEMPAEWQMPAELQKFTPEMAESALEQMGGDIEGYRALARRADNFDKLSALVENATKPAADTGNVLPMLAGAGKILAGSNPIIAAAHALLTKVGQNVVQQRAASTVATLANTLVLDTVSSALKRIVPLMTTGTAGEAARAVGKRLPESEVAPLTPEQKQERYRDQLDTVNRALNTPDLEARAELIDKTAGHFSTALSLAAGASMQGKLMQLHADIPKPQPNVRGKAFETLSMQQVQLANAMYEATVNPMSVFSDFAAGRVDYAKVSYAWKQYPGLQQAAQAGMLDILHAQMGDSQREQVPERLLTQLDNLFGFDGQLQPTLTSGFSARMEQIAQQSQPKNPPPRPGGAMQLPTTQPTFTERLSGQRKQP